MYRKFIIILFLPFNYVLYFLSGFIPRVNNIWVFGSFGIFNDNSSYLFKYIKRNSDLRIRAIWISKNRLSVYKAREYGEAYYAFSLKGLYYCLISKVYVFSAYTSDINFFTSRRALKVNLWHGIPLKKIEFDITTKPLVDRFTNASSLRKIITPEAQIKPDLVLSPSRFVADYSFRSAFRVKDENIIVAEYPRVSYLKNSMPLDEYSHYKKIFLYVPTWRDDSRDFIKESGINFDKLNEVMKANDSIFIFKFHSATKIDIDLSFFTNLVFVGNKVDPIRLMKTADCLITDYSSIYFDYLYLDRPIIHFCFDIESYLKNREMYLDYDSSLAGYKAINFDSLLLEIINVINGGDLYSKIRMSIFNKFIQSSNDGNKYIVERIFNKLES